MAGRESATTILKILSGVQSGVDVALVDGDYTLGSGDDDDIQLIDVSLKPGHARLSIRSGKIEIGGAAGQLRTGNGLVLEPGGDLQSIEPLDVVSAGTTRFAIGPTTANWATITDAEVDAAAFAPARPAKAASGVGSAAPRRSWLATVPVLVVLLILVGFGLAPIYSSQQRTSDEDVSRTDLEIVQTSLAPFDFVHRLAMRQELDGVVYVTGFVDAPVQRRAALAAIRETAIPARVRIAVLDLIRNEVAHLIQAENAGVEFSLSDTGELTLTGVILDAARADALAATVRERVTGLAAVHSEIRTAPSLLADVQALSDRSRIHPLVLLRLDGHLIEASGLIPTDKIDSWVGFLQAYSSQFAAVIPLRSFVQLQNPDGTTTPLPPDGSGLYLGSGAPEGDVALDVERLRSGGFDLTDIFVGQDRAALMQAAGAAPLGGGATPVTQQGQAILHGRDRIDLAALLGIETGSDADTASAGERRDAAGMVAGVVLPGSGGSAAFGTGEATSGGGTPGAGPSDAARGAGTGDEPRTRIVGGGSIWSPGAGGATPQGEEGSGNGFPVIGDGLSGAGGLDSMARRLFELWEDERLQGDEGFESLREAMDALYEHRLGGAGAAGAPITERYAPLLARARGAAVGDRCWRDSLLTSDTVTGVLFWLDLLSVSADLSIVDFDPHQQPLILEAALNPEWTRICAASAAGAPVQSTYLYETSRNGDFIRYITRDIAAFPIDVAGVSVVGDRYIQTRSGQRMREGSAPDERSRLLLVGELGVAVERDNGYSTFIFDSNVNWRIR